MNVKIGIVGLGYVGLPLALAFAKKFPDTIGYDISDAKIDALRRGMDPTEEGLESEIDNSSLRYTNEIEGLRACNFYVIGVPTPVDEFHNPDLSPLCKASAAIGKVIKRGDTVVFESTVYPGVTEDVCGPIIAEKSGLVAGVDFRLGYSPERINPGDKVHTLENIVKVVSGQDEETLELVSNVYGRIIDAGIHRAPSIKVAEAAKVIENTQRDINIALMNELALIFDRMGISTRDVLDAAGTKWNFLKFSPGLVGGHCIGVDPYYLTTKAELLGYHPQVILAGRRINDNMGNFIAQKMVKLMVHSGAPVKGSRVGILGLTFKENVSDIRNSRVPSIIEELHQFGVTTIIHDPLANQHAAMEEYGVRLSSLDDFKDLDGIVFAVPHNEYLQMEPELLYSMMHPKGVFVDVKAALHAKKIPESVTYWGL